MIEREAGLTVATSLTETAAVVLLGARQVGKTTLARSIAQGWPGPARYLDIENPADARRLEDPGAFLGNLSGELVVLDEIQRMPSIFPVLRGIIDENRRKGFRYGQFLLLGSSSLDLLKNVDESLAGRVAHLSLAGIAADEATDAGISLRRLWLRGGFPESLTAASDDRSARVNMNLVRTYLERDVPMFAPRIPSETLRRLWTMIAHNSGGLLNAAQLGAGLGISAPTVVRYLDLLIDLCLVRRLEPWFTNVGKRLTRSPKIYIRDTGMLHALLEIGNMNVLLGHPAVGGSYESMCVESLCSAAPYGLHPYFYRTAAGDEIDLVFTRAGEPTLAIEVKHSTAPVLSPGFYRGCDSLGISQRYLVYPGAESYSQHGITVIGLDDLTRRLRTM